MQGELFGGRAEGVPFAVRNRVKGQRRAGESFGSASACLGPVEAGMSLFAVTRGQFSMLDCILHYLNELGGGSVSVWTWAIADYEVDAMCGLMARGDIERGTLIIDAAADRRSPQTIEKWRGRFGAAEVKVIRNHSKLARVWNRDFKLLLRGSMNLNYNPRFEQLDVTEGGPEFDLVESIEAGLPVLPRDYDNNQVQAASSLGLAFEKSTLQMFEGVKPWAK